MKTQNYNADLLVPFAASKEIYFNSAISLFDAILSKSILSEHDEFPENPEESALYLVSDKIAIYINSAWQTIKPKEGMIFFRLDTENFIVYKNNEWKAISA